MKHGLFLLVFFCGVAVAQPPNPIPTGLSGPNYQSAVNAWLSYLYTGKAPATSGTAILKGNGSGGFSAASAGTDYLAPNGSAASLTNFPTFNQNTSGTAANLSGTPALPNGTTATTQSASDNSTKIASTAYADAAALARVYTANFLLCAGPCVANETSNWKWTAPAARTVTGCVLDAGTYPTGSGSTTVNVYKNGTSLSVFSSTALAIAGGATAYNEQTGMDSSNKVLAKGDYLTAKVTAVAGTVTGQYLNVVCTVQ